MYGEINGWSPAGAYTCRMIRAVAKVQVQLGPSFSSVVSDFSPETVNWRIYLASSAGFVQPKSTLAGVPSGYNTTSVANFLKKSGATEAETTLYIYEFQSSIHRIGDTTKIIDPGQFDAERPCIMLIKQPGISNGGRYRLEFYDHADSKYMDLKRNHHYLFTINKVNSLPYEDQHQVFAYPGSNLEYTIIVDGSMQYISSNGQYAIATSVDMIRISGDVDSMAVTTFRYINPTKVTIAPGRVIVDTLSIQPTGATLQITSPVVNEQTPITDQTQTLRITASDDLEEGVFLFQVGNIYHRLHVKRQPQP
jgi:hypothetical protein